MAYNFELFSENKHCFYMNKGGTMQKGYYIVINIKFYGINYSMCRYWYRGNLIKFDCILLYSSETCEYLYKFPVKRQLVCYGVALNSLPI